MTAADRALLVACARELERMLEERIVRYGGAFNLAEHYRLCDRMDNIARLREEANAREGAQVDEAE